MQLTRQILTDLVRTLEKSEVDHDSATKHALRLAQNHLTSDNGHEAAEITEKGVMFHPQHDNTYLPAGTKLYA